jgi:hypothetical protein
VMAGSSTTNKTKNAKSQATTMWQNSPTWQTSATLQNTNNANTSNWSSQELTKISQEGYDAMHSIRAARVAIFNGQPDVAMALLSKAKSNLDAISKNWPTTATTTQNATSGNTGVAVTTNTNANNTNNTDNANWVSIDAQVSLADTFVATPEKTRHINNANKHFKNGQTKNAVEELRLAAIDVSCTRVLMSLSTTTNCVNEATKLLNEQKYYQANLALKAAEDKLVVDSTNLWATPNANNANVNVKGLKKTTVKAGYNASTKKTKSNTNVNSNANNTNTNTNNNTNAAGTSKSNTGVNVNTNNGSQNDMN